MSADPILGKYLPSGGRNQNLSGMGGVFNSPNLALYIYSHQNPIKFVDPDGNETAETRSSRISAGRTAVSNEVLFQNSQVAASTVSGLPVESSWIMAAKGGSYSDCSGFMSSLASSLPDGSYNQYDATERVGMNEIIPGDFVFFKTGDGDKKTDHVGMISEVSYFGGGTEKVLGYKKPKSFKMIHSAKGKGRVEETIAIGKGLGSKIVGFGAQDRSTDPPRPNQSLREAAKYLLSGPPGGTE